MIKLDDLAHKIKTYRFKNLNFYNIFIFFWKGLVNGSLSTRASSLAFNFFLAFFPSIIVVFTLIPYIPINGLEKTLIEIIADILPPNTNKITFNAINDIVHNPNGELLSLGFLIALYFSTNGINSLIEAFNSSYHINESRSMLKQKILSFILTFIIGTILMIAILLIIFTKIIINYLVKIKLITSLSIKSIIFGKWIIIISMLFFGITLLFNLGPAIKEKWKIITPGALISTFLIIITSIAFNYYIDNFSNYNKIYGSIGTLIILLLWIYINAIILLIGFELNVSILNAKKNKLMFK